ncbi:MAG: cytochrome c peroxidase [Maribacter sp.]|jgi:cytochrome c peroxidase
MKFKYLALFILAFILISGTIDLDNLFDYDNQTIPNYINKDNTPIDNAITDEGATLGRVLFYDQRLSANNTISCASCHSQEFAFSDTDQLSLGLNGGLTGRHAMRLVNSRFSDEDHFFWDERAATLEEQTTQPIQDHVEMGFSGGDGDPGIDSLITKLSEIEDYDRLFEFVYGDAGITEDRIQKSIAQFIRSIQSFDSKFDTGLAMVNNINNNFPNFTAEENQGKTIFITPPNGPVTGAGCQGCHRAPEFDIDPNTLNNGVITVAGDPNAVDLTNTRSPSLRDLVNPAGQLNGPLMHNGEFSSIMDVINHYDNVPFDPQVNTNLDQRLIVAGVPGPGGGPQGQNLNLTLVEKEALEAFLLTLTGSDIYTNDMYSDPFDPDGSLELLPIIVGCSPPVIYGVDVPTTTSASFTWDAVDDAILYQVKYRLRGTTAWSTQGTTNLQRTITGLTTKKYYQYKLRTQCGTDNWSDFTDIGLFYTSTCDAPTGVASVYLDNTRMRVRWDANPDEIKGKIRYRAVGTTEWITQNSADGNNFLYVNDLPADALVQYKVRSNCDGNDWSEYSALYTHDLSAVAKLAQGTLDAIKLYPNPAKEVLNVQLNTVGYAQISISDISGRLVLNKNVIINETGQTEILDISKLVKGYHILTIQTNEGIVSKKFVVVK